MMIGQLGETEVAAVGIANLIFFLVTLLFFGITSGTVIFSTQYWRTKDINRIQYTGIVPFYEFVRSINLLFRCYTRPG